MRYFFFALAFSLLLISCNGSHQPKPIAFGQPSEVVVLVNKLEGRSYLSDTINHYLGQPFLLSPQPESLFDIQWVPLNNTPGKWLDHQSILLTGVYNEGRNELASFIKKELKVSPEFNESGWWIAVLDNPWSYGQKVYVLVAKDVVTFKSKSALLYSQLVDKLTADELNRLSTALFEQGVNTKAKAELAQRLSVSLDIPYDFEEAISLSDDFRWYSKQKESETYGVFVTDTLALLPLNIGSFKQFRNARTAQYLKYETDSSFMQIEDVDLPVFMQRKSINSISNVAEYHGVWKVTNDYMGGSFLSYMFHDSSRQSTVLVDAFYYAPKQKKRDGINLLEAILVTTDSKPSK